VEDNADKNVREMGDEREGVIGIELLEIDEA
jgi:hypothetical protein